MTHDSPPSESLYSVCVFCYMFLLGWFECRMSKIAHIVIKLFLCNFPHPAFTAPGRSCPDTLPDLSTSPRLIGQHPCGTPCSPHLVTADTHLTYCTPAFKIHPTFSITVICISLNGTQTVEVVRRLSGLARVKEFSNTELNTDNIPSNYTLTIFHLITHWQYSI